MRSKPQSRNVVTKEEELERRRSAVHSVAPVASAGPSVAELRDRYIVLATAREYAPERLSVRALHIFNEHQRVSLLHGCEDEDIYADTALGAIMREELQRAVPDWFEP